MKLALALLAGVAVCVLVVHLLRQRHLGPSEWKHFLVVHHFGSESQLADLLEYEKTSMDEIKGAIKTPDATCKFAIRSKDSLRQYCYWVARDSDAIRVCLQGLSRFFSHSTIEETSPLYAF